MDSMYRGLPETSIWTDHGSIQFGRNDLDVEHQHSLFNEIDALLKKEEKSCVDITNIINIFAHLEPATSAKFDDKTWMILKGILKDHAPPGILRPSPAVENLHGQVKDKKKCLMQ